MAWPMAMTNSTPSPVCICGVICVFAMLSTEGSSCLNYIASTVHLLEIVFIIVVGLKKADAA